MRLHAALIVLLAITALAMPAAARAASGKILLYGPTISGSPDTEATLAAADGFTTTVADASTWSSMTTAQFAAYDAIVFGDPTCSADHSLLSAAIANEATWSAAVGGPVVVIGTDPIFHQTQGIGQDRLIRNGIEYAASQARTGLYVSLSCFWAGGGHVDLLDQFGSFDAYPQYGCPNSAAILDATHPVMTGLTNDLLSDWSCSVHEALTSYPSDLQPLVRDNSTGYPYILATPTGDHSPPTAVTGFAADVRTGFDVHLAWNAAADNVGVDHYRITRGGTFLAETTGTEYTDATATAGATYTYGITAYDAAGNVGPQRTVTITDVDSVPPTAPRSLNGHYLLKKGKPQIQISWLGSTDNVALAGYRILRNGSLYTSTTKKSFVDKSVSLGHTYTYQVAGVDSSGNVSAGSNTVSIVTGDTTPPTAPTGVAASIIAGPAVHLRWNASTDNAAVHHYTVFRDGDALASTTSTTLDDAAVTQGDTYAYKIVAYDTSGNPSPDSLTVRIAVPDQTAPGPPGDLQATPMTPTSIRLEWDAAPDNVGTTGYEVFRNGVQIATLRAVETYTDATVSAPLLAQTYTVRALDAAGNRSMLSNPATASTSFGDAFESGDLSHWSSVTGNVTAQKTIIYNGRWAARSVSTGGPAFLARTTGSPQTNLFFRTFLNVRSVGPTGLTFYAFKDTSGTPIVSVFRNNAGMLAVRTLAGGTFASTTPVSLGAWHELQTHVVIDGPTSEFAVWFDGVKIAALSTPQNLGTTPIGSLQLGSEVSGRTWDVVFDKVGIATFFQTY
jgi:fibronectin type 3 domain-containing protein